MGLRLFSVNRAFETSEAQNSGPEEFGGILVLEGAAPRKTS